MKGTEVHVIVLVCWVITVSWLSCACHVHSVLCLPVQSSLTSFWRSFTALVQLIFSFPSWFHTIWFYCSHTFHRFLSQITLCFRLDRKTWSQAQQLYTAGIPLLEAYLLPMANNWTRNKHLSQEQNGRQPCGSCTCTFSAEYKWPTYHVAVCRTNRKRSSFAMKHFQRKSLKIFNLHPPPRRLVSFVAPINT